MVCVVRVNVSAGEASPSPKLVNFPPPPRAISFIFQRVIRIPDKLKSIKSASKTNILDETVMVIRYTHNDICAKHTYDWEAGP